MAGFACGPEEIRDYLHRVELSARRSGPLGGHAAEILRYGGFVGSSVERHRELVRAMERARQHIDRCEEEGRAVESGRIIMAERLSAPKGRFTRKWHAPAGGLWGCLIHANTLTPRSSMLFSLAAGVAACEALDAYLPGRPALRWINDVLIDGGKAAGFLIESHTGRRWKEQFHLLGFGINVNNTSFPPELRDTAVSLRGRRGAPVDLREFSLVFFAKLTWNIGLLYFVEAGGTGGPDDDGVHPVVSRWSELADTLGRKVVFGYDVISKPQYRATAVAIAGDGGLEMKLEDGHSLTEHSGEIRYL